MGNSPARSVIDVGSVIDKYVIEALIGRGGMGAVFLARHRTLTDKKVAIKVLHAEIHDADIQARFKREAQIATKIDHPNIVEVHDFDVTPDGVPYLVLEYLEGVTLAQRIANVGPLPLDQVTSILRQVGSALAAAHRENIVHRDLKPQNIFLVPMEVDGRLVEVAKVLDFGISKWRGSETVKTQESALLGTPQYMAPEQATGRHDAVDQRTDVFALGAIVHEMLSGQPAFTGASIPEVVFKVVYEAPLPLPAGVPDHVASAVRKAMAKQSDERYATVSDFIEGLTGSALATFRPSMITKPPADIGFASGSKKITSEDALGDTMGSGDYGAKPVPAPAPVITPPPVRASSPTVESVATRPDVPVPVPAKPAGGRGAVFALVGLGAIAATAAIMYFVMRSPDKPANPATPSDPPVATTPAPAAVDAAVVAQATPDAAAPPAPPPATPNEQRVAAAIDEARSTAPGEPKTGEKPTPKRPTEPKTPPPAPPAPPEEVEDGGEGGDEIKETLMKAKEALANGDYDLANRYANMVANRGGPRQRVQAARIKGLVACQKKDLELANAALNQLGRNARIRAEIVALCRSRGLDGVR
ncbi:MAG: protein kinase [Myxococcales bacterium]|nr:protein kinase [Myxococcales bacterium]